MKYKPLSETNANISNRYICPAVFANIHYNMDDLMGPCCLNTITKSTTIEEYRKNSTLLKLKSDMLAGVRNPICNKCYSLEDSNLGSHRMDWLRLTTPDIFETKDIFHLELRFSNLCNLKCRTCYSTVSSRISTEDKQYFGSTRDILRFSGPTEEFVLEECKKVIKDVQIITFSGGEPMLHWQHWALLDYLIENNLNPTLMYYSNNTTLTFKDQHIFDKWKHFDNVLYRASIDAVGKEAEYLRQGETWDVVIGNIKKIKKEMPHVKIEYTVTVSWLNILQIGKVIDEIKSFDPYNIININQAWSPWFQIQMLSPEMKEVVTNYLQELWKKDCPLELKSSMLGLITSMNSQDMSKTLYESMKKLKKVDEVRGESFIEVFPEFKEMALKYGY